VIPLFADQDYNAYRIEAQNVGLRLEIKTLTFSDLDKAISEILTNKRYKENMEIKSKLYRNRPQSPLQETVFWTEFVLKNNDLTSLKPMNGHHWWFQRRLLDVYIFWSAVLFLIAAVLARIIWAVVLSSKKAIRQKIKMS